MATEARERKDEEVIMFDDDQDLQEELVVNKEYK